MTKDGTTDKGLPSGRKLFLALFGLAGLGVGVWMFRSRRRRRGRPRRRPG